jgi:hypothetical protein
MILLSMLTISCLVEFLSIQIFLAISDRRRVFRLPQMSLAELLLSPHFDSDLFISESLKSPDTLGILAQLDYAEQELQVLAKDAALKFAAQDMARATLAAKCEAELLAVRESAAGLRRAAEAAQELVGSVGSEVRRQTEIYSRASEASKLARRCQLFAADLKKVKTIFPEKEDRMPLDVAVKFAKAIKPLLEISCAVEGVRIFTEDLAKIQTQASSLGARFARDIRAALKSGNHSMAMESAEGINALGYLNEEIARLTEELVGHVRKHGSIELINTAAQAVLLAAVVDSPEPSREFWQKTLARRPEAKYYSICRESRGIAEQVLLLVGSAIAVDSLFPEF